MCFFGIHKWEDMKVRIITYKSLYPFTPVTGNMGILIHQKCKRCKKGKAFLDTLHGKIKKEK